MTERTIEKVMGGVVLCISALCVGCGPTTNTALERAQANYQQAQQNPQITTHAPTALQQAQLSLQRAERAWRNEKDDEQVAHLAYITEQRIGIAQATAEKKIAEQEIKKLNSEREQVLLTARTRAAEAAHAQAEQAAARVQQLQQELTELKTKQTERGLVVTLNDVLFEYNKAALKPGAMRNLYQLVTFLKENPTRNVLIEGYTDSRGSESYNLDLSRRRAQAVENFLVQNGVDPARLLTRGYGEAYPVASNDTAAGRQENRRVELVILRQGELAADQKR